MPSRQGPDAFYRILDHDLPIFLKNTYRRTEKLTQWLTYQQNTFTIERKINSFVLRVSDLTFADGDTATRAVGASDW